MIKKGSYFKGNILKSIKIIASIGHFGRRKKNSSSRTISKIFGFTESSLIYHLHFDTRSANLVNIEHTTGSASVLVVTGFIFNKMGFVAAVELQLVLLLR